MSLFEYEWYLANITQSKVLSAVVETTFGVVKLVDGVDVRIRPFQKLTAILLRRILRRFVHEFWFILLRCDFFHNAETRMSLLKLHMRAHDVNMWRENAHHFTQIRQIQRLLYP